MDQESPEQRKRRLARERQQRQRDKKAAHKAAMGAREIRFEMYRGTTEALNRLCRLGGYDEAAEVITLLIHGADELAGRDPSRFKELLCVKGHAHSEKASCN